MTRPDALPVAGSTTPAVGPSGRRTATAPDPACSAAILVEGPSDELAVRTLARRRGRDLAAEGVAVVDMGGATNVGRWAARLGPAGADLRLAGLCDAREERFFRRGLPRGGGVFVCHDDLEDELVRALGPAAVEAVMDVAGELEQFRVFQRQPAQRQRPVSRQLRRFIGTRSGRKIRYGGLLVEALDLDRVPRCLDAVLAAV